MRNVADRVKKQVKRVSDAFGAGGDTDTENDLFADAADDRDYQDDAAILSIAVMDLFSPDSVLDIGCGIGLHLKPFLDADDGIAVKGFDESDVAHENAVIPTKYIDIRDLTASYDPGKRYDVVLCIDMLEYTSKQHEAALIETVANTGDTAVVSVATPHYDALHFSNVEPLDYWIDRFGEYDMAFDEDATATLMEMITADEDAWIPDRVLVFRNEP